MKDKTMLSLEARELLEAEREQLSAERQKLKEEIGRLAGESNRVSELIRSITDLLAKSRGAAAAEPDPPANEPVFTELRFRDAIKMVLREAGLRGMKPKEVTAALEQRGWSSDEATKTKLNTRVSNDLWRMEKSGQLRKNKKNGRYRLVDEEKSEEA